jgi:hypothetical protein
MDDVEPDASSINFSTVREQMATGMHSEPRIRSREANGRIATSTAFQKKLASVVADVKFAQKNARPNISKGLYHNIYAALGMEPATKKHKAEKAAGVNTDTLLRYLMDHVVLPDGTRFKVYEKQGFDIVKVRGTNRSACIVDADLFCVV